MTKSQLGLLGSVLAAGALAIAGCGGGGGGGGTGGKADGGTGGKADGGGMGGTGTGGRIDAGSAGTTGTDAGNDVRADSGSGGSDARADTGPSDTGPCVTSYPNGAVQFAFDNGANLGWSGSTGGDVSTTTASVGGSLIEGSKCPGALSLFITYGSHVGQSVTVNYNHNNPPLNWSGFGKAHFWIKVVASDYSAYNGFQTYVQSQTNYQNYKSAYTIPSTVSDGAWHESVVDITASDLPNVVQIGVQVQFAAAPDGGTNNGGTLTLFVDDIWLENAPPPDAAPDVPPDVPTDTGTDVPPADTGVDVPAGDVATDTTTG
jgi:hypothetical protein